MDEWLRKNKHVFDSWKVRFGSFLLIIGLSVGVIYSPDYFAYIAGVIVFCIFYISAKVSELENDIYLSDTDILQMKKDLIELEKELATAHMQAEENPEDASIKLLVAALNEEIETLKNTIPGD